MICEPGDLRKRKSVDRGYILKIDYKDNTNLTVKMDCGYKLQSFFIISANGDKSMP